MVGLLTMVLMVLRRFISSMGRISILLKQALLNKESVWIEVGAMWSLCTEGVLTAGIGRTASPISSEGDIAVQSNLPLPRVEL